MNFKYANPDLLRSLDQLIFELKNTVSGNLAGKHLSNSIGKSLEFVQHREYSTGDDIRSIDWKVYARRDKYFIKQYRQETNLNCYFLLDCSTSMWFKKSNEITKYEYASTLISCLSYILLNQNDSVGLIKYDNKILEMIPSRSRKEYFYKIVSSLENEVVGGESDYQNFLSQIKQSIKEKFLLFFVSDLVFDSKKMVRLLKQIACSGVYVYVLHTISPIEKKLDFDLENVVFEDIENNTKKITTYLSEIKKIYVKLFNERIELFNRELNEQKIRYIEVDISVPIIENIRNILRV